MSSDYSVGMTIHRVDTREMSAADLGAIREAVVKIRESESQGPPRYSEFEFRYGISSGVRYNNGGNATYVPDGVLIGLRDNFIGDDMNEAPAEVMLQRDIPTASELIAKLQNELGDQFDVQLSVID